MLYELYGLLYGLWYGLYGLVYGGAVCFMLCLYAVHVCSSECVQCSSDSAVQQDVMYAGCRE